MTAVRDNTHAAYRAYLSLVADALEAPLAENGVAGTWVLDVLCQLRTREIPPYLTGEGISDARDLIVNLLDLWSDRDHNLHHVFKQADEIALYLSEYYDDDSFVGVFLPLSDRSDKS